MSELIARIYGISYSTSIVVVPQDGRLSKSSQRQEVE